MTEDLLDYWLRIIKPFFPANAWFAARFSGGDHLIQIDWRLESDGRQPHKRSRKIEIIIKEDFIDAYLGGKKDERLFSDGKIKKWISEHYDQYKIDQDALTSNPASPDKWRISKDVLTE